MNSPSSRATLFRGLLAFAALAITGVLAIQLIRLTGSVPPLRAASTFLSVFFVGFTPGLWATIVFRDRSGIRPWHPLLFLPALACWSVLSEYLGPGGSLTNAFAEPLYLGVVASVLEIARLFLPRTNRHGLVLWSAGITLLVAVSFVFFFPNLPE
jgi:hypothetical protein